MLFATIAAVDSLMLNVSLIDGINAWMNMELLVMCEYSKFRIESNSYFSIDSIWNEYKYSKFSNAYRHQFLTYLNRMTPIFHLRNHA